jgi:alkylation response protein AidB-like acyl-CoA dehydrogenase
MDAIRFDEALVAKARELGPVLREHAAEAERGRRLTEPALAALRRERLTAMFLPRALGGHETDPLTCMHVVEEVSSADPAAGWLLMVANGSSWMGCTLPAATAQAVFADLNDCLVAAAFQPPVEAREAPGGFRLTGRRRYASGIHSARHVVLTGMLMDGDRPRIVDGQPQIICAWVARGNYTIHDTWYGLGLRGSDSCDVEVKDTFVPSDFATPLAPVFERNALYRAPLYRLPLVAAIPITHLAPIGLAIGRSAIQALRELAAARVPLASTVPLRARGAVQEKVGRAEAMLRAARGLLYSAMDDAWARTRAGEPLDLERRAGLLLAGVHAVQTAAEVTDSMFELGGSSAVFVGHPLERLIRDISVIRQHGFMCRARYETAGQVLLGAEVDLPLLYVG